MRERKNRKIGVESKFSTLKKKQKGGLREKLNPRKLDILGQPFQLKYSKGSETFQTLVGGVLSSCIILALVGVLVITALNLFDTTKPDVVSANTILPKTEEVDLYKERLIYPIAFTRGLSILDPDEVSKYLTLRLAISKFYLADPVKNINGFDITLDAPYKPCKDLQNKEWLEDYREEGFENALNLTYIYGLCPDLDGLEDKLKILGKFEDPPYINARIYIGPCSLPDKTQCKSIQEITSITVVTIAPKKMFDPSNKKNPLKTVLQLDKEYSIGSNHTRFYSYNSKRVRVYDDSWDFFEANFKLEYSYFELDYIDSSEHSQPRDYCPGGTLADFVSEVCPTYMLLFFVATGDLTKVTRTYPKILDAAGQIGGVAEVFMVIGGLIYSGYNSRLLLRFLKMRLFGNNFVKDCSRFLYNKDPNKGLDFEIGGEGRGLSQVLPDEVNPKSKNI